MYIFSIDDAKKMKIKMNLKRNDKITRVVDKFLCFILSLKKTLEISKRRERD